MESATPPRGTSIEEYNTALIAIQRASLHSAESSILSLQDSLRSALSTPTGHSTPSASGSSTPNPALAPPPAYTSATASSRLQALAETLRRRAGVIAGEVVQTGRRDRRTWWDEEEEEDEDEESSASASEEEEEEGVAYIGNGASHPFRSRGGRELEQDKIEREWREERLRSKTWRARMDASGAAVRDEEGEREKRWASRLERGVVDANGDRIRRRRKNEKKRRKRDDGESDDEEEEVAVWKLVDVCGR